MTLLYETLPNQEPALTPEMTADHVARHGAEWESRCPRSRPISFRWPADLATLRETPVLLNALRRVADEITDSHWLRIYCHRPVVLAAARERMDPVVPTYRPWADFIIAGQGEPDARQELWQRDVGDNLPALALAARLFGDEKYVRAVKNHVLTACRYPTWGDSLQLTNRDLACAHLVRGIAIARDWLPEIWSEEELGTIQRTLADRAGELLKAAYGGAYWHTNWRDNHCQNSVMALGICGLIFLGEIPAAAEWLAAAEIGLGFVARLGNPDGSSAEGLPYWSYGMSFLVQYIEATRGVTGSDRAYDAPYFKNAFGYRLQSATPAIGATLPFGDAVAHDYYGPGYLLRAFARHQRNPHAQWLAEKIPFRQTGGADIEAWDLLWNDPTLSAAPPDLALDAHFPDWDVVVTRSGWAKDDSMLAIKSGFTNRNHSHLDVGALVLAWGDEWLLTAPGYGFIGPGFWDRANARWTFYSNATESHTTLLINGQNQRIDRDARGTIELFETAPNVSRTVIDLTGAYDGVRSVRREVIHRRGERILITDTVELTGDGNAEWLLQPGGRVECAGGAVYARGEHGHLEARMLWPDLPFTPRAPTQPNLDVPPESVKTHTVSQRGKSLRFVCEILLFPISSKERIQ